MKKIIGFLALFAIPYTIALAAPSTTMNIPNSFSPSTTIQSSKVNDNNTEVQTKYNAHTHTDITQLSTITAGVWNGTEIATQYGGTGQDFSAKSQGSVPYFNGTGTMDVLAPGTSTYVLTSNGTGANPSWTAISGSRDGIVRGLEVSASVAKLEITVYSGILFHGGTIINSSTNCTLTLSTAADWSSGSIVNYGGGADWCYLGVNSAGWVRLLGPLAYPDCSDASGSKDGTKSYYYDGTQYWKVIGASRINTSNQNAYSQYQSGNFIMLDPPVNITTTLSLGAWSSATSCASVIPAISNLALFGVYSNENSGAAGITIRANDWAWLALDANNGYASGLWSNAGTSSDIGGEITSFTDSSQQIQYYNATADDSTSIMVKAYYLNIR